MQQWSRSRLDPPAASELGHPAAPHCGARTVKLDEGGHVGGQACAESAVFDEEDGVLRADGEPGPGDLAGEGDVLGGAPEPGHRAAAGRDREGLGLGVGLAIQPREEVGDERLGCILLLLPLAVRPLVAAAAPRCVGESIDVLSAPRL